MYRGWFVIPNNTACISIIHDDGRGGKERTGTHHLTANPLFPKMVLTVCQLNLARFGNPKIGCTLSSSHAIVLGSTLAETSHQYGWIHGDDNELERTSWVSAPEDSFPFFFLSFLSDRFGIARFEEGPGFHHFVSRDFRSDGRS